nr:Metazoa galactosyltransferase domain containing protein [Haemonchus contortus]
MFHQRLFQVCRIISFLPSIIGFLFAEICNLTVDKNVATLVFECAGSDRIPYPALQAVVVVEVVIMMTKGKVKILLAIFIVGGVLHLIVDKGQLIYNNFDRISTYVDSDPLEYVLANTATHLDEEHHSTIPYLSSDTTAGTRHPHIDMMLNANDTDEAVEASNVTYPLTIQRSELESCPLTPPRLVGPIRVWMDAPTFSSLEKLYPYLENGGHGQPKDCGNYRTVS